MTSAELSELANIPKSTLDKFLSLQTDNPSHANICSIVRVLGGSMDEMLGLKAPQKNSSKGVDTELLIAMHDKERQAWLEMIGSQREEINKQSRHIRRLLAMVAVLVVALVVMCWMNTTFLSDAVDPTRGNWMPRITQSPTGH